MARKFADEPAPKAPPGGAKPPPPAAEDGSALQGAEQAMLKGMQDLSTAMLQDDHQGILDAAKGGTSRKDDKLIAKAVDEDQGEAEPTPPPTPRKFDMKQDMEFMDLSHLDWVSEEETESTEEEEPPPAPSQEGSQGELRQEIEIDVPTKKKKKKKVKKVLFLSSSFFAAGARRVMLRYGKNRVSSSPGAAVEGPSRCRTLPID